jgi:hypothetical protein
MSMTWPSDAFERETFLKEFNDDFEVSNCTSAIKSFEEFEATEIPIVLAVRVKAIDCYFTLRDTSKMKMQLKRLDNLHSTKFKSVIYNQRASLSAYSGDTLEAINLLKMVLDIENNNNFVKRNYELLKKLYQPNDNSPPSKNQKNNKESNSLNGGLVSESDEKEDTLESIEPPEIERSQALQLLDALRSEEYNKLPVLFDSKSDTLDYGNW